MKQLFWDVLAVDHDTFRWIVGGLLGVICSIGGFWLSHLTGKIEDIAADIASRNQRISVLEANVGAVSQRLDRIESKIDYLIEARHERK
jgi:hypothetical protein